MSSRLTTDLPKALCMPTVDCLQHYSFYTLIDKHAPRITKLKKIQFQSLVLFFLRLCFHIQIHRPTCWEPLETMHCAFHLSPQPIIIKNSYFHLTRNTKPILQCKIAYYNVAYSVYVYRYTLLLSRPDACTVMERIGRRYCEPVITVRREGESQEEEARMTFLQGARNLKSRHCKQWSKKVSQRVFLCRLS